MQAINPINTHTKFGKDRINTFPQMSGNQASGRRMPEKAKITCPPPSGVDIIRLERIRAKQEDDVTRRTPSE